MNSLLYQTSAHWTLELLSENPDEK